MNRLRDPGRSPRILIVDCDAASRAGVAETLVDAGYETREEGTAAAAERALEEFEPELVVLEAALPDGDGFDLARRLTANRPCARLIFVTSRERTEEKVAGLAYADHYLVKPINRLELLARMRAILRRIPTHEPILRFADVVLNAETREVARNGDQLALTPREFDLLRLFMLNRVACCRSRRSSPRSGRSPPGPGRASSRPT